jgi:hypothetical protein
MPSQTTSTPSTFPVLLSCSTNNSLLSSTKFSEIFTQINPVKTGFFYPKHAVKQQTVIKGIINLACIYPFK